MNKRDRDKLTVIHRELHALCDDLEARVNLTPGATPNALETLIERWWTKLDRTLRDLRQLLRDTAPPWDA